MTLDELQVRSAVQSDNEFDDLFALIAMVNTVIEDINLNHSAKFKFIDLDLEDTTQQIEDLTGMPWQYNSILITGLTWKLQQKEDESNWPSYEAQYKQLRNAYKHLVPAEYSIGYYNDIATRDCDSMPWDLD